MEKIASKGQMNDKILLITTLLQFTRLKSFHLKVYREILFRTSVYNYA